MVFSTQDGPVNPYLSTQKSPDSVPAALHPLVLLSISDHLTRHTLRGQQGPVVGALLGQQIDRAVTIEHTFDFFVEINAEGDASFSPVWFNDRLEQMKTVHNKPQLDLVGWYTVLGRSGPTPPVVQIHEQILRRCSESATAVLLAFHPEDLAEQPVGGKLPLTIYETTHEAAEDGSGSGSGGDGDTAAAAAAAASQATASATAAPGAAVSAAESSEGGQQDKEMTDAFPERPGTATSPTAAGDSAVGASSSAQLQQQQQIFGSRGAIKFREIPFTVETHEAEMISIDFVARGVANASTAEGGRRGSIGGSGATESAATAPGTSRDASEQGAKAVGTVDAVSGGSSGSRDRAVAIESSDNKGKRRLVAAVSESAGGGGGSSNAAAAAAGKAANAKGSGDDATAVADDGLTLEDEELIATLTSRANAIRMLHSRLQLLTQYVQAVEASGTDEAPATPHNNSGETGDEGGVTASLPILRSIQALVQRVSLVVPPPANGEFEDEQQRQENDVHLISVLLDDMMQSIAAARQTGAKFNVLEQSRGSRLGRHSGDFTGLGGGGALGGGGGGVGNSGASNLDMLL